MFYVFLYLTLAAITEKSCRFLELFSNSLKQLCFSKNETFMKTFKNKMLGLGEAFFKLKGFI